MKAKTRNSDPPGFTPPRNGFVKWPALLGVLSGICGGAFMVFTYVLDQHEQHPHEDAASKEYLDMVVRPINSDIKEIKTDLKSVLKRLPSKE